MNKKYWFKRKLYGWGWTPSSWEGWLVTGAFLVIIIATGLSFTSETTVLEMVASLVAPALILIAICYMTGERPRWQWGSRIEDDEHKPFE